MDKKVLVTGLNIISSLGLNKDETWKNLIAGKSGVTGISLFDPVRVDTKIAAQVPASFDEYSHNFIKKRIAAQMTRVTRMCYVCAVECVNSSGIQFDQYDRERCGVIIGAVSTGNSSIESGTTPHNRIIKSMSNAMPAWISMHYKLEGPTFTVNTACASSAHALGLGFDFIKNGRADMMIIGGADSTINPEEIEGFNNLYTLSTENGEPGKASRPFSKERDGFVLGEGAGAIILESENSARARRAEIYAEMAGYSITSEAYNIMSPMKDGEGMAKTMEMALRDSGIKKSEINYINAHGTSTTLNDAFETMAIKKVFGERACHIPVSSVKSMIGHTIGAAGVIEAAITAMSIRRGIITPTINLEQADPELDLDFVSLGAREHAITAALSNSFAFGGHNATIVLKKYA